ncbi:hypothetical protein AKJ09_06943 [Labilithrix luteola]|uniref:Uncharacterized protein n=1 Tax=Labilithrix luteola TaxID=1391654 RepID=A0A0K1Q4G8_9BACT|nr:hypothetical protein [Labilithrix luteola]AKV00280.1 hypothetical protein AKJ09_06943 [Labilithrix luteola]
MFSALLLVACWACEQPSATKAASIAKEAPTTDAAPKVPPASTPITNEPPLASAPVVIAAAPGFTPTRLAMGVSFDVPQGFSVVRDDDSSALFAGPQGARLLVASQGECGLGEKVLCQPTNDNEKKWARSATKTSCLITGVRGDTIVWERGRVVDGVVYTIRFEYPKAAKAAYDPIISRVSKTWKVPDRMLGGFYCGPPLGGGPVGD